MKSFGGGDHGCQRVEQGSRDRSSGNRSAAQHTFRRIFRLKTALDGGDGDRELVRTFDFLKAYAAIHFRTEEEWMVRHRYAKAEAHREWHQNFTVQVKALADAPAGDPELKGAEVVRFLENWFVGHIQQEDLRMVAATREPSCKA